MTFDKMHLVYGTPSYDKPHWPYVLSRDALLQPKSEMFQSREFIQTGGFAHMARSKIALYAADRGCKYFVMHDDDLSIQYEGGNLLDRWARFLDVNPGAAVIGANYLQAGPLISTCRMFGPEEKWEDKNFRLHGKEYEVAPTWYMVLRGWRPGFQEVGTIGTGLVMIRTEALAELPAPLFRLVPWCTAGADAPIDTTEDIDMCFRLRRNHWSIYVDNDVETFHHKDIGILHWKREEWEARKEHDVRPLRNGEDFVLQRTEDGLTRLVKPPSKLVSVP